MSFAVLLHHVTGFDFGVRQSRSMLFFVISGYCAVGSMIGVMSACRSVQGRELRRAVWSFIAKRMIRLWVPMAAVMGIIAIITFVFDYRTPHLRPRLGWETWLSNMSLMSWVHLWGDNRALPFQNRGAIVRMHWTLTYEAQFTLLAAACIVLGIWGLRRGVAGKVLGYSLVGGLGIGSVAFVFANPNTVTGVLPDYGACFALGVLVFLRLWKRRSWNWAIDAGLIVFTIGLWIIHHRTAVFDGTPRRYAAQEICIAAAFAILLIIVHRWDDVLSRAWMLAPVRWIGRISYSLFLIHPVNLKFVKMMIDRALPAHAPGWLNDALQLGVHVLLAAAFWWLVERPLVRKLRESRSV